MCKCWFKQNKIHLYFERIAETNKWWRQNLYWWKKFNGVNIYQNKRGGVVLPLLQMVWLHGALTKLDGTKLTGVWIKWKASSLHRTYLSPDMNKYRESTLESTNFSLRNFFLISANPGTEYAFKLTNGVLIRLYLGAVLHPRNYLEIS